MSTTGEPIVVRCEHCGQRLRAPPETAGSITNCPKCKARVLVPAQFDDAIIDNVRHEADVLSLIARPRLDTTNAKPPIAMLRQIPKYTMLDVFGSLMRVAGIFSMAASALAMLLTLVTTTEVGNFVVMVYAIGGLLTGIIYTGIGTGLKALRDIAQNSWYLKPH